MRLIEDKPTIESINARFCRSVVEFVRNANDGATDAEVVSLLKMATRFLEGSIAARGGDLPLVRVIPLDQNDSK